MDMNFTKIILPRLSEKKVIYCFLSGLMTSLWLYSETYSSADAPVVLQFTMIGILPGLLFPAALVLTENQVVVKKAVRFFLLAELVYVLSAISLWITTIHDYFIPVAMWFLSIVIPLSIFFMYYYLIKKVYGVKNARNWIFFLGIGSTMLFTIIGYIKVHFFHAYMTHPVRMQEYFRFIIWCCPVWQTGFAVVVTRDKYTNR